MITTPKLIKWEGKFLRHFKSKGKSENSLKSYRLDFECFHDFIATLAHQEIKDFNQVVLSEFEHFLEKKYPNINSRRRKLQTLRLFFDFLLEFDLYHLNPIKNIASSPKALLPPSPVHFCNLYRVQSYLYEQIYLEKKPLQQLILKRNICLLKLIYEAGISIALLSKLNKKDIILNGDQSRVLLRPNKRDPYSVPLRDPDFFQTYLNDLEEFSIEKPFKELLFYANAHKIIRGGLSPRGIEETFKTLSKKLDIEITPKKIRQSAIVKWVIEGHQDNNIKEWMGVAPSYSLSFYKKYVRDQKEENSENSDLLDYGDLKP